LCCHLCGDEGTNSFQAREETNKCQATTSSASSLWWPSTYETPLPARGR
jgi:hypothetical protein